MTWIKQGPRSRPSVRAATGKDRLAKNADQTKVGEEPTEYTDYTEAG